MQLDKIDRNGKFLNHENLPPGSQKETLLQTYPVPRFKFCKWKILPNQKK